MIASLDVSDVGDGFLEVETGNLGTEFSFYLEGTQITMSYEQTEKLYLLLKPYFEVEEGEQD